MDLSEFEVGDSIYITYNTYEGEYYTSIPYTFSNDTPTSSDDEILTDEIKCYSHSYTEHKHNETDKHGNYIVYYTYDYYYYFEFEKPEDKRYLIMGYDLTGYDSNVYLYVDNTRLSILVIAGIVIGVMFGVPCVFTFGTALLYYLRHKFHCCSSGGSGREKGGRLSVTPQGPECAAKSGSSSYITDSNYNTAQELLLTTIPSSSPENNTNPEEEKPAPPPEDNTADYNNTGEEQA